MKAALKSSGYLAAILIGMGIESFPTPRGIVYIVTAATLALCILLLDSYKEPSPTRRRAELLADIRQSSGTGEARLDLVTPADRQEKLSGDIRDEPAEEPTEHWVSFMGRRLR